MRKILKLSITLVLAIAMLFAVAIIASAGTEPTDSGNCGNKNDAVIWEYYEDTQTLVISGTGSVQKFERMSYQPWYKYRDNIKNLIIEEGIRNVYDFAFGNLKKVETLTLPDSLVFIGMNAFYDMDSLHTLNLGTGLEHILKNAFHRASGTAPIQVVNVPSMKDWCEIFFAYPSSNPAINSNLYIDGVLAKDVVFPADVTSVPQYAFYKVLSVENVTFHEEIESIGYFCFNGAKNIKSVSFEGCTPVIDTYAFKDLQKNVFTDLYISDAKAWFETEFVTLKSNPMYVGPVNVHINGVVLDQNRDSKLNLVVPDGVTEISPYALYSRYSMGSMTIPATVTSIDPAGMYYSIRLKTIFGEEGSFAADYAASNRLAFEAITPAEVSDITVENEDVTLAVGETVDVAAVITPAEGTLSSVVWSSSDISVARVGNGVVTAFGSGTAVITATTSDGTVSDSFTVTVPVVAITSAELDADVVEIELGHKAKLDYSINPVNATVTKVEFISKDKTVATVSTTGVITPKAAGTTTITLYVNGTKRDTCTVTVIDPNASADIKVTGVALDANAAVLKPGETLQLNATVTPADATNANVTWKSSNDAVATVVDGLVTAIADGDATITVTTVDGEFTATCEIVVETPAPEFVPLEGLAFDVDKLELVIGDTYKLTVVYTPDNTTEVDVLWSIDSESILEFNEDGEIVAVGVGKTWVYVEHPENPDIYAECEVTVIAGRAVEAIALNKTTANLTVSDKLTLEVTFTPANATNKNIIWTTDKDTVATVENGVVTAVGSGVAIITATSEENPALSVTCKIIVEGTNETPALPW